MEAPSSAPSPHAPNLHSWDHFLIGPENALAHASALALARGERAGISPLVVHGPSGVGKSLLLAGLVAEYLVRWPAGAIAHLTAEEFGAACLGATEQGSGWLTVRERFRSLDLLVIEDLHALDHAPAALMELTHTIDALDDACAIVAVSARAAPQAWSDWPERLVNRLLGGLAVLMDRPGLALRRRYVLARAQMRGVKLPAHAAESLAEAADGYHTLDGWLVQIALAARLQGRIIDRSFVEALVAGDVAHPAATIEEIAHDVAAAFGVRVGALRSSSRRQSVALPRHLAICLAREFTRASTRAIGAYFGGRDTATVRHSCRAAEARLASDPKYAATASVLRRHWRLVDRDQVRSG